jgi:hypothetical protein
MEGLAGFLDPDIVGPILGRLQGLLVGVESLLLGYGCLPQTATERDLWVPTRPQGESFLLQRWEPQRSIVKRAKWSLDGKKMAETWSGKFGKILET